MRNTQKKAQAVDQDYKLPLSQYPREYSGWTSPVRLAPPNTPAEPKDLLLNCLCHTPQDAPQRTRVHVKQVGFGSTLEAYTILNKWF